MKIPFAKNAYQTRSKPLSAQACINAYPELIEAGQGKTDIVLYGTPGLKPYVNFNVAEPLIGLFQMGNSAYAVIANGDVHRIDDGGLTTPLGNIGGVGSRIQGADNGTQLVLVKADGSAYVVTSTAVAAITDPDYLLSNSVTYLNGYHVFTEQNSQVFFISELFNAASYDALDFASTIRRSDLLVAAQRVNDQIWLFGELSIEIYYESGAADFPLSPIPGGLIQKGVISPDSIQAINTSVIWVGDDKVVYSAEGFVPTKISTPAIDYLLSTLESPESIYSFQYYQQGHIFYGMTAPEENGWTLVFDTTTGLWHQRKSYGLPYWRGRTVLNMFGKVLVGDNTTAKIYEMDLDTYDEDGTPLILEVVSAPIWVDNKRFRMFNTRIDLESGVGLNSGQGSDPQIMLSISDDGGFNFGNEYWRSMGKIGEYSMRATWKRLGQSRQRYLKIKISDPVKRVILGCYTDLEVDDG